jgi:hypothetical protein
VESVVATGVWMYDEAVPTTVRVVMLDYDFWYAVAAADGELEPDETPELNEEGRLYYVRHRPGWPAEGCSFWPYSQGFHFLTEGSGRCCRSHRAGSDCLAVEGRHDGDGLTGCQASASAVDGRRGGHVRGVGSWC